ncbi:alpha/beta fold hydrolase [Fodinicola acaciae]|uniref:alpha/beta fold hydrolase n=1 Tax=Fodinicola acaciae TaxID=2681555 RepID=UPI0013D81023|nr:alpha/beta hydrolase [Fodinicola acaciae]
MDLDRDFHWRGRRVAWTTAGSGPAVVFCHGTPFSSQLWKPFAEALSRDHTVHLWDMPGYGRSSKRPDQPTDFGAQAEAFAALLEHWQLEEPPHVVAHDFGGAVSLRTHLVHGVDFASLMLVDVVAIPPSGSPFFRFVQENPRLLGQLPGYVHRALVRAYVDNAAYRDLDDDVLSSLSDPWTGDEGQPAFYQQIAEYDESFLAENERRLPDITIPVRVVWGENDPWIPVERAHRLQALIPGAELRTVAEAGHLIHFDAPIALMDELRAWLESH